MAAAEIKPTVLLQLDTDPQPSVFDAVVAADSGVAHLLRHGGVKPESVRGLVHGLLFTRGPDDLHRSAVSVGGSDVAAAEAVLRAVTASFFGPFRVSVLLDANGSNTTAAAATLAALDGAEGSLKGVHSAVIGAGPVGRRVARLLTRMGAKVALGARAGDRPEDAAAALGEATGAAVGSFHTDDPGVLAESLADAVVVIAAGPAGVTVLSSEVRRTLRHLKALIDLNAVPPAGIESVEPGAKGTDLDGARGWGALAVGGIKMKIHKRAVRELFESNDKVLDAEAILDVGKMVG